MHASGRPVNKDLKEHTFMTRFSLRLLLITAFFSSTLLGSSAAQSNGESSYQQSCAECHGPTLQGGAHAPALSGEMFENKWSDNNGSALVDYIRNEMPPGQAGRLSELAYSEIANFLLGGGSPVPPPNESDTVPSGQTTRIGTKEPLALSVVTDALLQAPPDADWPSWRRTLDNHGYSPLDQIDKTNVNQLQLAWAISMRDGQNQTSPIVHDGVMFLANPGNVVQAIDGATGDILWEYRYEFPPDSLTGTGATRGLALYQDKIFLSTYDAAIVAIDTATGDQVWRTEKADYTQGYTQTSTPVVANGVIVSGINGCERFTDDGCFITGHDPETGEEIWRTSTIALPGDINNGSWGDIPPHLRGGGDTWIPGSYDPDLNLFYIGTAQAKPWVAASRGMSTQNDALYTNSTLALNPTTGSVSWYFQHVPAETLDLDSVYERVLIDLDDQRYLFTASKDGLLWKLNRENGEFLGVKETVFQNIFESINHSTGTVTYRPDISAAAVGEPVQACPGLFGGHNWQSSAYSPENETLIIPLQQMCMNLTGQPVELTEGSGGTAGIPEILHMPGTDNQVGKLAAYNVRTLEEMWSIQQRASFLTSATTTGGGLVFIGDVDRYFKALDATTGDVLWETRLGHAAHGYPITYEANGTQYVAVPTGLGLFRTISAVLSPEIFSPSNGNALYVFALPQE